MTANADLDEGEMWNQIRWYFQQNANLRAQIDIFKKMYDANGDETEDKAQAVKSTYDIVTLKLLDSPSVISVNVVKASTQATIEIGLPTEIQLSSPPLAGRYRIKCIIDETGNFQYTRDMQLDWGADTIRNFIEQDCYGFKDAIKVSKTSGQFW